MKTLGIVKRPSYVIAKFAGMLTTICFMIVASAIIASASRYDITDLGAKGNSMNSNSGFNNSDQLEGSYPLADGALKAFQSEGTMADLTNIVNEAPSPTTLYPSAINDAAQVSAYGQPNEQQQTLLWMPVAITVALLLLSSGLACLILLRRRLAK